MNGGRQGTNYELRITGSAGQSGQMPVIRNSSFVIRNSRLGVGRAL